MIKAKIERVLMSDGQLVFLTQVTWPCGAKEDEREAVLDGQDKNTLQAVKDASAKLWRELYVED